MEKEKKSQSWLWEFSGDGTDKNMSHFEDEVDNPTDVEILSFNAFEFFAVLGLQNMLSFSTIG